MKCNKIITAVIITASLLLLCKTGNTQDRQPALGIAVTGFGAPAISIIGVLEVLNEYHIKVRYAAGTSLGAMIIGLYSCGYTPSEIQSMFQRIQYESYLQDRTSRDTVAIGERKYSDYHLLRINFSGAGIELPKGLLYAQKILSLLDLYAMGCTYNANMDFNKLPVPLRIVATSLDNGSPVTLDSGMLSNALRATISMPPYISPFQYHGTRLVDGALSEPLPVGLLKQMGANIVLSVIPDEKEPETSSALGIVNRLFYAYKTAAVHEESEHADVVITPATSSYDIADFQDIERLVALGRIAAYKAIPRILDLISPARPVSYDTSDITAETRIPENSTGHRIIGINPADVPSISEIRITGNVKTSDGVIRRRISVMPGDAFNVDRIIADQQSIYALGYFENVYFTIKKHPGNEVILEYHVVEKPTTYIGIGLRDDMDEGLEELVDFNMDNFLGTGTRLYLHTISGKRMTYQIGYEVPELLSTGTGMGVKGFYKRNELFLYNNERKVSLYAQSQWGGEFDAGHYTSTNGMLFAFYRYEYVKVSEILGNSIGSPPASNPQTAGLGFRYDTLDDTTFPLHGMLLDTEISNVNSPGRSTAGGYYNFNRFMGSFKGYKTFTGIHTFGVDANIGGIDNGTVPFYESFSLGGMSYVHGYYQLAGYDREEFIGKDLAAGSLSYLLKMPQPSSSFLKRWFVAVNLQSGDVFNSISQAKFKTGLDFGIYFDTFLSPIRFDAGWAGDGHVAYYLTAGYSF